MFSSKELAISTVVARWLPSSTPKLHAVLSACWCILLVWWSDMLIITKGCNVIFGDEDGSTAQEDSLLAAL